MRSQSEALGVRSQHRNLAELRGNPTKFNPQQEPAGKSSLKKKRKHLRDFWGQKLLLGLSHHAMQTTAAQPRLELSLSLPVAGARSGVRKLPWTVSAPRHS